MNRPTIRLHIEELELHSFAANDRYAIADAVQRELSNLLTASLASGASLGLSSGSNYAQIDAGSFQLEHGAKAHSIGAQIANAVHGGLTR
jgi:hypothetical protein